ncbi:MAG: RDD family protein, partial [Pseudomonadota bacterium]
GINMDNPNAIAIAMRSAEFGKYVTGEKYATYIGCVFLISFVLLSFYFIFFWYKMGWTPGKYILGLRVVDADTLERISLYQSIKRFIWYALALISIWFIIFTKKHQGLHDKIARTIVIKR